MRKRLPFAVNHYLCPRSLAVPGFLAHLGGHGFSGVGLTQAALLELPAAPLRQELREHGLRISSVNTAGFFLQDGDAGRDQAARNTALLRSAAEVGAALNVIAGGSATLSLPEARARAAEQLADGMATMVCGSRSICLLRGDSGEAPSSGCFLPVMGPRAWEACSGSKSRVGGVDWRV